MIVVTGATGNVGRPLVQALAAAGEKVTALSRRRGEAPRTPEVANRVADLTDPDSLRPALEGADALFLLLPPEVLMGGQPSRLLGAIRAAGVARVVLLSTQIAATRPDSVSHAAFASYERAVRDVGVDWTILRPSGFHSNALAWAGSVRAERTVFAPFGDVALPTVDPVDVAQVAAAALTGDAHTGRAYLLTGPAAITPRAQAAAIGDALGEAVSFVELTRDQAREHLTRMMPEEVADGTLDIIGQPRPDEQRVSPDVAALLARPPHDFAAWAHHNAATFR